ncbi:MAG TPA: alpha/beta hydrolase [Methylomirabilota bacterium]|nr:alpha/beta hydrolase [Methylomirabilota bacterium]
MSWRGRSIIRRPLTGIPEAPMVLREDNLIEKVTDNRLPHYEPFGWHHWPEHPWLSYQFRRGLGETQEGGGTVSECLQAAARMIPGDTESWHREWLAVAERNFARGEDEMGRGHVRTAMNCWLRAADYYRQAEFFLPADDSRRLETFTKLERASHRFLAQLTPPGEVLEIPYEGKSLFAYFVRGPGAAERAPCLISMGGLDSIKDEMWFMQAHGALQRGISVLMIDGPGQGGTLRRHKITNRPDYEVPIGRCVDYLLTRRDVDPARLAVCGSSLGGYYAARAASREPRLAACVSHGAIWSIHDFWKNADESHGLAGHIKWVFGVRTMAEAVERFKAFTLDGVLEDMRCPYLILHGGHDVLGMSQATRAYEYAKAHGVNVTLRFVTPEETGAEHCQHDNPTIGQELMADWLADVLAVDQRALSRAAR